MTDREIIEGAGKIATHYGIVLQTDVLVEECSELIKAVLKHRRAVMKKDEKKMAECLENIREEVGDVELMLLQIKLLFQFDTHDIVEKKIKRQLKRIEDENGK